MKIAIVGYDVEGRSSFEYFSAAGHELVIRDQNAALLVPDGVPAVMGDGYLDDLDQFDLIVRTAGLPPHLILAKNPGVADKITTQLDTFLKVCPTRNIIGVTGTKGKGTTSTLITKMLEATGKTVHLGGNIGVAPFSFLHKLTADSWVVLELSSFQLVDIRTSPPIGVCLMVVPEHLNWHADMEDYAAAKKQLFAHQSTSDIAIYYAGSELSQEIAAVSPGTKLPYGAAPGAFVGQDGVVRIDGQDICATTEIRLIGAHNQQNVCAAITAVWQAGVRDVTAIRSVLTTFTGLPHRLEFVRELEGVSYYDDSFGTTPETAIVALQAFSAPKVVILGGSDKGASYDELASVVSQSNIRQVLLIGEQAERIQAALETAGCTNFIPGGNTMTEIVQAAQTAAQPGDIVLLSTACASFDMFANYKDRGQQFVTAVQALASTAQ